MPRITIPDDVGGDLRVFEEGVYDIILKKFTSGMSKESSQPKLTAQFVVESEYEGKRGKNYISTVGERVLENYSLQPQALFKLNTLYKTITGEKLPQGDYEMEEFAEMMTSALGNTSWRASLVHDDYTGEVRMKIDKIEPR